MITAVNFTTDYVLENERALLRPLRVSDFNHLIRFSTEQPEIWQYSLVTPAGAENLDKYLKTAEASRLQHKEYTFIMFDKRVNEYAGSSRFYDINPEYETLQLGYTWYGSEFWGTGLNKNCKFLLLEFAFTTWNMKRVEFRADNNNKRSIAAMKSIGCTVEGVLRSNMPTREGGRRDSIVLSILKEEWEGGLRQKLLEKCTG